MRVKKYRLLIIILFSIFLNIVNITCVQAALYKSKGDEIPLAKIEYDVNDNASVFPESYKESIRNLKKAHPNWTFMAVYTNLDWKQSIMHESFEVNEGISLVPMSYASSWKRDGKNYFQDGSWVTASKAAVAYAMDARNYLNEKKIFQFESLSCIEGLHTVEAVEKVLQGTDLETKYKQDESGNKVKDYPSFVNVNNVSVKMDKTYAQVIYEAGVESGVSPIHIATRIIQETGGKLANGSICGTNANFVGYYNFFNIGATPGADGNSAVTNGLITAKNNGWDTPEKSIKSGALTLYNSYIKYGQDTIYFQKFDVSNSKGNATMLYVCQYMTNILAPSSEATLTYNAYSQLGILDSSFVFYIPVYNNRTVDKAPMPGEASNYDENKIEDDNKKEEVIKVSNISVSKTTYSLAKGKSTEVTVIVSPENSNNKKYTASSSDKNIVKVEGNKITGVSQGKAKVTFKTEDGGFSTTIDVTVTEKEEFSIDDKKLNVNENNQITKIKPSTTVENILSNITVADTLKIETRNLNGKVLENSSLVGTGTTITITSSDSVVLSKYTVIIKGDVNGDGNITASDYVFIKNSIMGAMKLSNSQVLGADVNGDGKVTASDYVLIKNHIMGSSKLY